MGKPRRKLKLRGRGVRAETAHHVRGRHHTGMITLSGRIGQDEIAPVGCGLRGKASVPHKRATPVRGRGRIPLDWRTSGTEAQERT